jgi:hypothetical protein
MDYALFKEKHLDRIMTYRPAGGRREGGRMHSRRLNQSESRGKSGRQFTVRREKEDLVERKFPGFACSS